MLKSSPGYRNPLLRDAENSIIVFFMDTKNSSKSPFLWPRKILHPNLKPRLYANSNEVMLKALQIMKNTLTGGSALPSSYAPMLCRARPVLFASCCCVQPFAMRAFLRFVPNVVILNTVWFGPCCVNYNSSVCVSLLNWVSYFALKPV